MKLDLEGLDNLPYVEMSFSDIESIVDASFVKETRKKLNFNQYLFAKLIHVSKKTVEAWEQGKNPVGGGNAIIVYLIHENPSIASKLLKVVPHNGAAVSSKFERFVEYSSLFGSKDTVELPTVAWGQTDYELKGETPWNKNMNWNRA